MHQKCQYDQEQVATTTRFIPANEWPKYHPWPPLGGIRHLIFNARTNGFEKVIKRVGRRVLIDEKKFFKFIEEKNGDNER